MSANRKTRVAVIFGGRSSEHSVSCVSAGSVLRAIDRSVYEVVPVGISTDGRWVLAVDDPDSMVIRDGKLPEVDATRPPVVLPGDPTARALTVFDEGQPSGALGDIFGREGDIMLAARLPEMFGAVEPIETGVKAP